jgi:ribosomal protein L16/L10AE
MRQSGSKVFRVLYTRHSTRAADTDIHNARETNGLRDYQITASGSHNTTHNQYESSRKVVARILRRQKPRVKYVSSTRFATPYTSKSKNSRTGRGKGGIKHYIHNIDIFGPILALRKVHISRAPRIRDNIEKKLPISVRILRVHKHAVDSAPYSHITNRLAHVNHGVVSSVVTRINNTDKSRIQLLHGADRHTPTYTRQ